MRCKPPTARIRASGDEAIVVTGLRRSLQSAQNIKRNTEQIVDAIVAEDIGKLPDITVSDTAARIPGIQVERDRRRSRAACCCAASTAAIIRRPITAARSSPPRRARSRLQDFPAGGIQRVEAFKTSTANLVEPGLAGLINVRSRRPFDFSGFEVAGSVWANYPKQSRDIKPNAQLLLSNRWDVGRGRDRRADQLLLHAPPLSGFDPPPRLLHRRSRRRPFARLARNPLQ